MASPKMDKYTFQFAELRTGRAPALALAAVASEFVSSFRTSPHYEELLSALIARLLENEAVLSEESLRILLDSLNARQNALLEEERSKDKERLKKWTGTTKVVNKLEEESEDDDEDLDDEAREARAKIAEEEQNRKEAEWERIQKQHEEQVRRREENDALLRERARHVDAKVVEEQLRAQGAVLLNSGNLKQKKSSKQQQMGEEEMQALTREVAEVVKEKERLKTVLSTSDDELPAEIAKAKAELAEAETKATGMTMPVKKMDLNKGQITQLQQKLTKQNMEKSRFALQLKAAEPSAQRDELVALLEKRDALMIIVEANENAN